MNQQHIDFFKKILAGTASCSFHTYFRKHEQSLKNELPRSQYLRLKFKPIEEIEIILQQNNITYQLNPQAIKREKYLLCLHESVLDEHGFPSVGFETSRLNGAAHAFQNGNIDHAHQQLNAFLSSSTTEHDTLIETFIAICDIGNIEIKYGNQALGIFLLQYIAQQTSDCSRISNLILNAKTTLQSLSAATQNPSLSA